MTTILKPQPPEKSGFIPIPDPWDALAEEKVVAPPHPWLIPLDPGHEITAAPERQAIAPQGRPDALRLPKPTAPIRSAVAILLEEELKLADQVDEPLRNGICDAIAWLELAYG